MCRPSTPDHPLAKLLGEGQYNVYLMLKPISSAIEKAGGLPSIDIRLDEGGTGVQAGEAIFCFDCRVRANQPRSKAWEGG